MARSGGQKNRWENAIDFGNPRAVSKMTALGARPRIASAAMRGPWGASRNKTDPRFIGTRTPKIHICTQRGRALRLVQMSFASWVMGLRLILTFGMRIGTVPENQHVDKSVCKKVRQIL